MNRLCQKGVAVLMALLIVLAGFQIQIYASEQPFDQQTATESEIAKESELQSVVEDSDHTELEIKPSTEETDSSGAGTASSDEEADSSGEEADSSGEEADSSDEKADLNADSSGIGAEISVETADSPEETEEIAEDEPARTPARAAAAANSRITDTGGKTAINGYLEYIQAYSDGNYRYDFSMVTCRNGSCSQQLAYCLNVHYLLPNNKYYAETYINASNEDFLAVVNNSTLKVQSDRVRNAIMRCIYYGYPYNKAAQNFLSQATTRYGIPNRTYTNSDGITQNLAEEALHYATQLAIWYITDGTPNISYPPNTKLTPLYNLAYAIYKQAVADSATAPELEIDILTPTGLTFDGTSLTSNAQAMLATRTPSSIIETPTTSVSGVKFWDDAGHEDARPESITVHLYGSVLGNTFDTGLTKTITAEDEWEYSFSNLQKYSNGTEIVYSVEEDNVDPHYLVTAKGMNLTNTYQPLFDGSPVMPETGGRGATDFYVYGSVCLILTYIGIQIIKKRGYKR